MREVGLFLLLTFFVSLILLPGCDNVSSDDSITTSREECDNVPDCTSVEASGLTEISGDGRHVLHLVCPEEAPDIHNLDVDQNDNVIVEVMEWSENAVTASFRKQFPERAGLYQVFLGCSTEPFDGGEQFSGRSSLPDDFADEPSEVPTAENFKTPDACSDQIPNCVDVLTKRHAIGHLKTHKVDVHCPEDFWYAANRHTVSSGAVTIVENPFSKLRFNSKGDSFIITNWSPIHNHHWQISIACSGGCTYKPGGCPCEDKKEGCRNDPGCRTTTPRMTECDPDDPGNCWSVWSETCPDGDVWECNTTLGWVCCQSCA